MQWVTVVTTPLSHLLAADAITCNRRHQGDVWIEASLILHLRVLFFWTVSKRDQFFWPAKHLSHLLEFTPPSMCLV